MSSFLDDIKSPFRTGNSVGQLLVINISVFLILVILKLILNISGFSPSFFDKVVSWVAVPMNFKDLLFKPWTLFTYMFTHFGLWHIFGNMLFLYIFGKIFQDYASSKRVFAVYICGGLIGAVFAIISYYLIPSFSFFAPANIMVGASAGVMAIVLASATLVPDFTIHLIFLGSVRLKYIALFVLVLDLIGISSNENAGGHLAHIGGALFGYFFVVQMKKGNDFSVGFNKFWFWVKKIFRREPKIKIVHKRSLSDEEYNLIKKSEQEEIDAILDKISTSGYESLTKKEKEILFKASNKK